MLTKGSSPYQCKTISPAKRSHGPLQAHVLPSPRSSRDHPPGRSPFTSYPLTIPSKKEYCIFRSLRQPAKSTRMSASPGKTGPPSRRTTHSGSCRSSKSTARNCPSRTPSAAIWLGSLVSTAAPSLHHRNSRPGRPEPVGRGPGGLVG